MFRYLLICLMLFKGSAHAADVDFDAVKKAAAQGKENAKEAKEILAGEMTRAEIAEAQKLSREYWEAFGPGLNTQ